MINVAVIPAFLLSGALDTLDAAFASTGLRPTTDLVTFARLVVAEPSAIPGGLLSLLQVAAPDIAVLIVVGLGSGVAGLREVGRRFRFWSPEVGVRRGLAVWGACVATFVAMSLAVAALRSLLLPAEDVRFDTWSWGPGLVLAVVIAMFLDGGGLFEENGWRGFAQPRLQGRYGAFVASLVVGLLWGLWHLPVKLAIWLDHGPVGGSAVFALFIVNLVVLSVVIAFFFNKAGEATIIAVAMHGLWNDSAGLSGLAEVTTFWGEIAEGLAVLIPSLVVAVALTVATRGRLGLDRPPSPLPCLDKAR
jgi:membrane protease YdiL (CAAX protease family)